MKRGLELSRTVATFIVQKILNDDKGLNYISQTADRFFAVIKSTIYLIPVLSQGFNCPSNYDWRTRRKQKGWSKTSPTYNKMLP